MTKKYVIKDNEFEERYLTKYAFEFKTSLNKRDAEIFYSRKEAKRIAEACFDHYEIECVT